MGMDQKVKFPPQNLPAWTQFVDALAERKFPVQLRMIDNELAIPDEMPPHDWKELRVSTVAGMVTLRHDADGVSLVIWGNADDKLRQAWNALTWTFGHLTGGAIQVGTASQSAADFARQADLPDGFH